MKINNELLLYKKNIDGRKIYFKVDFVRVTEETIERINKLILKTLLPLFLDECVVCLRINDHKIREKSIPKVLNEIESDSYGPVVDIAADIAPRNEVMTSESVFDDVNVYAPPSPFRAAVGMSSDYREYCQTEFVKYDFKEAVRRLLCEDRVYSTVPYASYFGFGSFLEDYYHTTHEKYGQEKYAGFEFQIGVNDIAEGADELIVILEKLMDDISGIHAQTSGVISCSAAAYSHQYCFGDYGRLQHEDAVKNRMAEKGKRHADTYLNGAEWLTLISPQVMKRLDKASLKGSDKITYHEYDSGAVKVKMKKHLYDVKVQDMYEMKRLLKPALMPSRQYFPMDPNLGYSDILGYSDMFMNLRHKWQFAPLDPEEISISNTNFYRYEAFDVGYSPKREIMAVHQPELCLSKEAQELFYKHQWKSWD